MLADEDVKFAQQVRDGATHRTFMRGITVGSTVPGRVPIDALYIDDKAHNMADLANRFHVLAESQWLSLLDAIEADFAQLAGA